MKVAAFFMPEAGFETQGHGGTEIHCVSLCLCVSVVQKTLLTVQQLP